MPSLPTLRPVGRHKAYYDELKAIDAAHGAEIEALARQMKGGGGLRLRHAVPLALRYRLKLAALFAVLEDRNVVATGTYDRIKDSRFRYEDGTEGRFAPMRLLAEWVEAEGLPGAAPGCEEARP